VLAEHATNGSKQEWQNGKMCVSAGEHHDSLQDLDFNFYLKVFSGIISHSKYFSILYKFQNIFNREVQEL
jgi:hypothetical protein